MKKLMEVFKLSHVPRWSIIDIVKSQSVSDHAYRVARITQWILRHLVEQYGVSFSQTSADIIVAALAHDDDEALTGDIPTTTKPPSDVGEWPIEKVVIKLADVLEAYIFIRRYGVRTKTIEADHANKVFKLASELAQRLGVEPMAIITMVQEVMDAGERYE